MTTANEGNTTGIKAEKAKKTRKGTATTAERDARPVRRRREQQRAVETKNLILDAALVEFAEKGFDAASIRDIGTRTGLQHPLITYHYRTKEILWKAVAERLFSELRQRWDARAAEIEHLSPIDRLRAEYADFLKLTMERPLFHHFMLRESRPGNPRLPWLVSEILQPAMERLMPDIAKAQADGDLPTVNPVLIHYLMVGSITALSSLADEIKQVSGLAVHSPKVIKDYLGLIDAMIFSQTRAAKNKS